MAESAQALARRIHDDVLAPLVLGGALRPRRAIGARAALAIRDADAHAVGELADRAYEARLQRARRLAPVHAVARGDAASWMLGAAVHDFLLAAHPGWHGRLASGGSSRLLGSVHATLAGVAPCADVAEALARHAWLARYFDIRRTDTRVSWWIGEHVFQGEDPPARLSAWPRLRRVHVERTPRGLLESVAGDDVGPLGPERLRTLEATLRATPLTDLATCERTAPAFAWSAPTLALVATHAGRTLALRAMDLAREPVAVDRALGRATRALVESSPAALAIALRVLADRAIADASSPSFTGASETRDEAAAFAKDAGAAAALRTLQSEPFPASERERIGAVLDARARRLAPALRGHF